jgi:hypothetical protein
VKLLKKGEKNSPVVEQSDYSLSCSDVTPLASSPVCVSLGQVWSPVVVAQVGAWWSSYLESLLSWGLALPEGWGPSGLGNAAVSC